MKTLIILTGIALAALTAGCASTSRKTCTARIAHSPTEYDVCLGSKQVQVGDRVAFYKNKCTLPRRGPRKCHDEKIGEGIILKNLDEHLSTVKLDSEFKITESTSIQRIQ